MEDNLFDKIKESSQKYSEYEMPSNALDDFKAYSSKRKSTPSLYFNYIAIGTLFLLLIGSNMYWLISKSKNVIQKEGLMATVLKSDTVYITKYIDENQKDNLKSDDKNNPLINNNSVQFNNEKISQVELPTRNIKNSLFKVQESRNSKFKVKDTISNSKSIKISNATIFDENTDLNLEVDKIKNITIDEMVFLDQIPLKLLNRNIQDFKLNIDIHSKVFIRKKQSFLELIRPKSISIFGQAGLSIEKAENLLLLKGSQFGIGLTTLFSNQLRGRLVVNNSSSHGELEDLIVIPNGLPNVNSPAEAVLDELELTSSYLAVSIGLDYLLKPIYFLRPYIGFNYSIGKQQYRNLEYKFIYENQKLEISTDDSSVINNHQLGINFGSDINLSNNFDAFIDIIYNRQLNGNIKSRLHFNTGLQYHF